MNLPEAEAANDVLSTLWARKRIDQLTTARGKSGVDPAKTLNEITQLGLEFRILTENTSFVAVEDRVVNQNGKPVTIQVPVALPEGVDEDSPFRRMEIVTSLQRPPTVTRLNQTGYYSNSAGASATTVNVVTKSGTATKKQKAPTSGTGSGTGYGSGSGSGNGAARVISQGVFSLKAPIASTDGAPNIPTEKTPLTAEERRTQMLKDKLNAWLYAVVVRLEKKTAAGSNEALFVRDGKAEIKITLSVNSPGVLEKVRKAGIEIVTENGNVLIGKIAIEKLVDLAEIDEIKLVIPIA